MGSELPSITKLKFNSKLSIGAKFMFHIIMKIHTSGTYTIKKPSLNPLGIPPMIEWEVQISMKANPLWKSLVI
jgi:hypothetical protein